MQMVTTENPTGCVNNSNLKMVGLMAQHDYTSLGSELGHTGDSPMADAIYSGTLEHPALSYKAIHVIVKQLKHHPLLQDIIKWSPHAFCSMR
jgi:hypothetical protein